MTTHRDLTTPEEVLAALRAGERVEVLIGAHWDATGLHAESAIETIAFNLGIGFRYRAPAKPARPRTFTAAEVAEAMRSCVPEYGAWQRRSRTQDSKWTPWSEWDSRDRDDAFPQTTGRWMHEYRAMVAADDLHERITHWLRENEG